MALDKNKIKESLTIDDIKLILHDLGSAEPKKDLQGNLQFTTVCHHGDSHKLYYYEESQMFHCYSECSANMDIFDVTVRAKKQQGKELTFYQSVQYVVNLTGKQYTGDSIIESNNDKIDDWNWLNKLQKKDKIKVDLPVYDERVMDVFIHKPHQEWLDDKISAETMEKYNISYYQKDNGIVIPHYEMVNGNLVGIRRRSLNQDDIDNGKKYMPITVQNKLYSHSTMLNLYGLHKTKNAVKKLKKIMLLESEKSVLKCEDYYGDFNFTCAVCSSNISNFHRDIILSLGVEEVFIAFDKFRARKENETEEKYEQQLYEYQERLIKLANKFTPFCTVYVLWDDDSLLLNKDSPADRGKQVLEQLMKTKYEIKTINEVL